MWLEQEVALGTRRGGQLGQQPSWRVYEKDSGMPLSIERESWEDFQPQT